MLNKVGKFVPAKKLPLAFCTWGEDAVIQGKRGAARPFLVCRVDLRFAPTLTKLVLAQVKPGVRARVSRPQAEKGTNKVKMRAAAKRRRSGSEMAVSVAGGAGGPAGFKDVSDDSDTCDDSTS